VISAAPALHRPRRCVCRRTSTAIVAGRCYTCRHPGEATVRVATGRCRRCRQPLLGTRRDRKVCEACVIALRRGTPS